MDIEEFRKLEKVEWRKRTKKCAKIGVILENAEEKIRCYNNQRSAKSYNIAYHNVLGARHRSVSLVNEDGSVSEESLRVIVDGLKAFRMGRQIGGQMWGTFLEKLREKLRKDENREILKRLRTLRIESEEWKEHRDEIEKLYKELSTEGESSLHTGKKRFDVGATKIMNFLFPELFVMLDRNVAKTLNQLGLIKIRRKGSTYEFSPEIYWQVMKICKMELEEYQKRHDDLQSLLDMDDEPTALTRIFDKCTFAMAKQNNLC